jgi:hypothetical protein
MSERKAVTKTIANRYRRADKAGKGRILDELCATTGWRRDHARKALRTALRPMVVRPRAPRPPKYGPKVIAALIFCWAVLGMPAGKRLAPVLSELVAVLRRFGELDIDDGTAALLVGMSAATIDRRLAPERKKHELKGRSTTKPGSLLKSQIPVRTWADWDDAKPGFVEIDLVANDGGNAAGEHAWTLTVTDIATGRWPSRTVEAAVPFLGDPYSKATRRHDRPPSRRTSLVQPDGRRARSTRSIAQARYPAGKGSRNGDATPRIAAPGSPAPPDRARRR